MSLMPARWWKFRIRMEARSSLGLPSEIVSNPYPGHNRVPE